MPRGFNKDGTKGGFKKGHPCFSKGRKHTPATIEKLRLLKTGLRHTEETKRKISLLNIGRRFPLELRKHRSETYKGSNNPNWKGGITPINLAIRMSPRYQQWKIQVFKRDNHTCQKCGLKTRKIEAHHIKSFSQYPELRFDLENGQTLCIECHKKTDNYGNRKRLSDDRIRVFVLSGNVHS